MYLVLSFLWRKRIFTPASDFFRPDTVWTRNRGEMTPWVLTNPRRAWETRKIDFAPAFYILAVFFQMSESDALQETRNICSVITQATDNELQAFPRGVTEIGCLSIDSFMREVVLLLDCSYSLFPHFGISPFYLTTL